MNITKLKNRREWKKSSVMKQYRILRKKGTEMPHSGKYNIHLKMEYCCSAGNEAPCLKATLNLMQAVDGQVLMLLSKES